MMSATKLDAPARLDVVMMNEGLPPAVADGGEQRGHEPVTHVGLHADARAALVVAMHLILCGLGVPPDDGGFGGHAVLHLGPHSVLLIRHGIGWRGSGGALLHEVDERDDLPRVEPDAVCRAHVDEERSSPSEPDAFHLLATVRAAHEREARLPRKLAPRGKRNEVPKAYVLTGLLTSKKLAEVTRADERAEAARALLHVDRRHVESDPAERRAAATWAWQIADLARPRAARDTARTHLQRGWHG